MKRKQPWEIRHVVPTGDVIEHDTSRHGVCVCGPTWQFVKGWDGEYGGTVITHNSLDGREVADR